MIEIKGENLTSPEKVIYKAGQVKKGDIAEYYASVAESMLAYIQDRPLTLLRCPAGVAAGCFIQKHYKEKSNALVPIWVQEKKKKARYISVRDGVGLLELVQMGVVEIHTWNSKSPRIEYPDQIVFDLDPDPKQPWAVLEDTVYELREILDQLELQSFVKLTGGKGVHLVIPIEPRYSWGEIKNFTRTVSNELVSRDPDRRTVQSAKSKRKKKIYIDYLRNASGSTAVAPFSLRAKERATVAVPISWKEFESGIRSDAFDLKSTLVRSRRQKRNPWEGFLYGPQRIEVLETSRSRLS